MPLPTLEANSIPEGILPDIQKDDGASVQDEPTIAQNYDEPIANRRELWSYYRMYNFPFSSSLACRIDDSFSSVYHFGNNVGLFLICYSEHSLVLIFDSCVSYAGTRT